MVEAALSRFWNPYTRKNQLLGSSRKSRLKMDYWISKRCKKYLTRTCPMPKVRCSWLIIHILRSLTTQYRSQTPRASKLYSWMPRILSLRHGALKERMLILRFNTFQIIYKTKSRCLEICSNMVYRAVQVRKYTILIVIWTH